MPFDWFTIAAQIVNFTILLWLLKRFLYRPILDGLDARELRLKKILEQANAKKEAAKLCQEEFENKLHDLEVKRDLIMKKTLAEATNKRLKLFESAQQAADDMLNKRLTNMHEELQQLQRDLLKKNIKEVYAVARKVLTDLSGQEIQQVIIEKFLNQLRLLPDEQKGTLLGALKSSNNLVVVRSAFALSDEQKDQIKQTLSSLIKRRKAIVIAYKFNHFPELIAGLELNVGGWKFAWSIQQYVATLQENIQDLVQLVPIKRDVEFDQVPNHSQPAHH